MYTPGERGKRFTFDLLCLHIKVAFSIFCCFVVFGVDFTIVL